MITDHTDTAQRAFEASALPPKPRTVESALGYITRLLSMLPPAEQAGYDGKPSGDNIAALPDGTMVSISRICYPDGQLYKVLSDAPNGGPGWVENGFLIAGQTYVPYRGEFSTGRIAPGDITVPTPPTTPDPLTPRVVALEALEAEIVRQIGTVNKQAAALDGRIAALEAKVRALEARPVLAPPSVIPKIAIPKPSWWPF